MFSFLIKKAVVWFAKRQTEDKSEKQIDEKSKKQNDAEEALSKRLADNIKAIKNEMGDSGDVVIRELIIGGDLNIDGALIFIDGLINSIIVNDSIIHPLIAHARYNNLPTESKENILDYIQKAILSANEIEQASNKSDAINGFLSGDVLLLVDGIDKALIINSKGWEQRSVEEPASEAVIRGPRESFVENLRTNTSLLRRKIRNSSLTFESMIIGEKTRTNIGIAYLKGIVNPELIETVKKRLKAINTDSILESGYIEQYIEDSPASIFATIGYTEKPDVAAAKILEGRIAILVDGTPFVLTVPSLFIESFQSAEDYYFRPYFTTLLRFIRVIAYSITILSPALYVAITTFHQELIPTSLLITMASAREGVPFPAFVESLIMIITFEILREAGIRLPRPVGQAMSIVGALVIGEAAVSAGLIGAPMVIVVAITAVSGFVVPNQADSAVILRFILLILGASFGGFGITMGLLGTLVHMSALESFGFAYLSPIAPFDLEDSKDALIRAPIWLMVKRPKNMAMDKQRKEIMIPPAADGKDDSE